ncbi:MAG: hypothetical protein V9E94_07345 [Microthrixaceae bacterium]
MTSTGPTSTGPTSTARLWFIGAAICLLGLLGASLPADARSLSSRVKADDVDVITADRDAVRAELSRHGRAVRRSA